MEPQVSVIIPIYRPGYVLPICLGSVRRQVYQNLEVIPIDDAGPEPVREVIESFRVGDQRWKPIYHTRNLGLSASLNDGIAHATGEYILVLQQDCELLNDDAIETAVREAQTGMVCLVGTPTLPSGGLRAVEIGFAIIRDHIPISSSSPITTVAFSEFKCDLVPRRAFQAVGTFDQRMRLSGEDQLLSYRLRLAGWDLVQHPALTYRLRFGGERSLMASLRKDVLYGRTQAALLLLTRFGPLRVDWRDVQGRRRFINRFFSVLTAGSVAGLALSLAIPVFSWLFFACVPIIAIRMAIIGVRARRLSIPKPYARRSGFLALILVPVSDLVYATSFLVGALRHFVTRETTALPTP